MLSLITFVPIVGAIVLLFFPRDRNNAARWTALAIAALDLILSIVLMLIYSQENIGATFLGTFQLQENLAWISGLGINYSLAVDGISLILVVLTSLLTLVCIGASFNIERKVKNYMAFMLLLEGGLIGVFLASNLFLFYIFWEVMLIPAYFLIGTWGGERRIYATFKFVLFTSVGSFLMLAGIIALGYFHQQATGKPYTLDLVTLLNGKLDSGVQIWLLLAFAAAFAVKVPLVPFHSWLPDAYAEAPAPVTAMLAGAMAKAGAYGFLRYCIPLFPSAVQTLAPLFRTLAVIGILYCAWQALTQSDLKRILAYSSISHLGVIMLGMFAFNALGVQGSMLQMVNHGITITALFLIAGFLEQRTGTRHLGDFRGLATRIPILATVMLIASLSSLGLPGLNSFAGEFPALLGAFRNNIAFGTLGTIVVVPAAWYMIRFFQDVMEGPRRTEGHVGAMLRKGTLLDINVGEFLALSPLLALIFVIGLYPAPLTALLDQSVTNMMQNLGSAFIR
ncbi:MAG: NADH-quinone oxidoreductase subunit M [Chloroflexota bacterium]|nr:NADH-quinone oxidoreductase subunit M [Chloroflexota bacterium]